MVCHRFKELQDGRKSEPADEKVTKRAKDRSLPFPFELSHEMNFQLRCSVIVVQLAPQSFQVVGTCCMSLDNFQVYIQQRGEHVVVRVGGGYKSLQAPADRPDRSQHTLKVNNGCIASFSRKADIHVALRRRWAEG